MKENEKQDLRPMLARLGSGPFDHPDWVFEIKWDGYRCISRVHGAQADLFSRNGKSFNAAYAPVKKALERLDLEAVFDGEITMLDRTGKPKFELLQNYPESEGQLVYVIFDLLYFRGKDLRSHPLAERKAQLERILPDLTNLKYSRHVKRTGRDFFQAAERQGLEGIMAKKIDSRYRSGRRSAEWLKIKTQERQEAVVVGYTRPQGGRKHFGALLLAVYRSGELAYIGRVGGGFDEPLLEKSLARLKPLVRKNPPLIHPPQEKSITWVEPKLVCEVKFREWTKDGLLRQPIFLGWRDDKPAKDVIRETELPIGEYFGANTHEEKGAKTLNIKGKELALTHWDKIFWPKEKYTKGDLVEYYRSVAPYILPHLKNRPLSLNRFPHGITEESFYQKNVPDAPDWVRRETVRSDSEDREISYALCNDEPTLVYLIQLGCIEMNPWNSRVGNLERPDYLVIDLDPVLIPFKEVVRTALEFHMLFDRLGISSFCKTSGATGLHIYLPTGGKYDYGQVRKLAEIFVHLVNARLPETTSVERRPEKRRNRVYLDYLQNRKGQTMASAYSVRPLPGAPVSTPLVWDELNAKLDPLRFNMKNMLKRLHKKGDIWKPVLGKGFDMGKVLSKI